MKNNIIVTLLVITVFFCSSAYSQEEGEDVQSTSRLTGSVEFNTYYNDNVFSFSPVDLTTFSNLSNEIALAPTQKKKRLLKEKFGTINRLDDVVNTLKIRFSFSREFVKQAPTSFRFRVATSSFTHNSLKNYSTFTWELRQTLLRKYYVSLGYSILPDYYLRNLYYNDYSYSTRLRDHYGMLLMSKVSVPVQIGGNIFPRLSVAIGYEHERTSYTQEFIERKSKAHTLSLENDYTLSRAVKLHLNYNYGNVLADGADEPDSNIVDISSYSHRINFGTNIELKRLIKIPLQWNFDLVYELQTFTSSKILDKYHLGRKDHFTKLFTELDYTIIKNLILSINYTWEQNQTNLPETGDAGSYNAHQISMGAKYSFRF